LRGGDRDAFAHAVESAGALTEGATAYGLAQSALGPLVEGAAKLDAASLRRALREAAPALTLATQAMPHPDDPHLARAAGQLLATLARLEATADWPALVAASS
jgi:hypothetical protein